MCPEGEENALVLPSGTASSLGEKTRRHFRIHSRGTKIVSSSATTFVPVSFRHELLVVGEGDKAPVQLLQGGGVLPQDRLPDPPAG